MSSERLAPCGRVLPRGPPPRLGVGERGGLPQAPRPSVPSQASPSVSGRTSGATAQRKQRRRKDLGSHLEMQTHRCLFVQQRDKHKRVLSSVLPGRWAASGVPGRVGQAPLASRPRGAPPAARPPPHLSQRLLSAGSVPGAGPGSRDAGPRVSGADASLHRTLWCSCKQTGGVRRGRGEPKQTGRAPGGSRAWGRPRPAAGLEVGT